MKPHSHEKIELLYICSGEINVTVDLPAESLKSGQAKRQRITLKANEFFFIDSDLKHCIHIEEKHANERTRLMNVEFGIVQKGMEDELPENDRYGRPTAIVRCENFLKDTPEFENFLELERPVIHLKDEDELLLSAMRLLLNGLEDPDRTRDYQWLLESPFKILMWNVAKRQPSSELQGAERHVEFANQFIEANFDRPISLQDVANYVDIHPAYLQRIYHNEQGITLMNYVNELRMEKAQFLVGDTTLSIEEIALQVGFKSRQSFSLAFDKYFDMNPQTYRAFIASRRT